MKHDSAALVGSSVYETVMEFPDVASVRVNRGLFYTCKRAIDLGFAILALPFLLVFTVVLLVANAIWNPGPVFYRQVRMGLDGKAFTMWKFRTMSGNGAKVRAADAPLEKSRITPLGRLLRRIKLDELPNIINILTGDMSLVGPRPDAFEHATAYLYCVPHYRKRFSVRPGITGLAQVRGGYADSQRSVERKARYDNFYIRKSSLRMELYVITLTFAVVFSGFGQR